MRARAVVGVDLGGTRIRVVATGVVAGRSRGLVAAAPALADLPRFLRRCWRGWKLSRGEVDALVVAARGIWTAAERRALERRLERLAGRVQVISDVEAAYAGALGDGPGILVLAGTGSIAFGRTRRGCAARAGGLGPLLGDEGSAFWIGREWLRASAGGTGPGSIRELARAPDAVARIAALAPGVLRRAQRGHRIPRRIVALAEEHLAIVIRDVARRLRLKEPVRVSWAGSLLANRRFRAGVWRALRRQGMMARVVPPAATAVAAAHSLAERLGGTIRG